MKFTNKNLPSIIFSIIFSITLSFLSLQVSAGKTYLEKSLKENIKIRAYYERNYDHLSFSKGGREIYHTQFPYLSEGFKTFEIHRDWLVSYFRKGVHGEHMIVIDLRNGEVLFDQTSSWPCEVSISEKGITISTFGDRLKGKDDYKKTTTSLSF